MALVSDRIGGADAGRLAHLWPLLPIIFLPNLALPFTELFRDHPSPWRLSAVLIGVMLFIALYLWTGWKNDISRPIYPAGAQARPTRWRWGPVIGLTGLSIAVILGDGPRWMSLLIFTSAAAGGRFSLGIATRAVGGLMGLAALLGWLTHDNVTDFGPAAFWTGMAGILTIIINHFRRTNKALSSAREEIARLAVETERLRFARDLHDLLGHDLARIALQSEVAEALASTAPDRAI
ncbi:MAG TPA: histidine kinase dimerization/phosphoacceptor domain-containing protein, partial [Chloroflexota bacterium]|nr:histidine kinase dimerization/phosphoacceptor domain-containing protein [Chloroflexota bacterium]